MRTIYSALKAKAILIGLIGILACQLNVVHASTTRSALFSFALIGDQPYDDSLEPATESLIKAINNDPDVQFILHIGDIKGGGEPCTDALLKRRIAQMKRSEKPLAYVPGDNEWTDCHRESNGNYDPQERLRFLRKQVFSEPRTLGQKSFQIRQQNERAFPEHSMWQKASTLFISLNVPGSNNDLSNPKSRKTGEKEVQSLFMERDQAIDAWLTEAENLFIAGNSDLTETVIAIQGNPIDVSGSPLNLINLWRTGNGYERFMTRLVKYIERTKRPVLLAHGDTHRFKWDRPSLEEFGGTAAINTLFYRVEGWGHPFVNSWVKISVKPGTDVPFRVQSITPNTEQSN